MEKKKSSTSSYPRGTYDEHRISGLTQHVESKKLKPGEKTKTVSVRTSTTEDHEYLVNLSARGLGEVIAFARMEGFVPLSPPKRKRRTKKAE